MRFFLYYFLLLLFFFFIWVGIVYFQTSNPTNMSNWVTKVYKKKSDYAKSIKEKKLIVVAGSNTLFGFDSAKFSNTFNIPVVNYGVNAGVFLPYILYKAKSVINDNDIVLLPLEYPMYNYNGIPNEQMIDIIFSRDFNLFFELTLKEEFLMLWNITFNRLIKGYTDKSNINDFKGLYGEHNINKYGDQINTDEKYKNEDMIKQLNRYNANKYENNFNENNLAWDYLTDFVQWCKKKSVKVIFMPSTMMYFDNYKNDLKNKEFYTNLPKFIQNKKWNFVGNPYDYMYDKKYYFNTDFHLTKEGKELRTNQMIKDLKNKFKGL